MVLGGLGSPCGVHSMTGRGGRQPGGCCRKTGRGHMWHKGRGAAVRLGVRGDQGGLGLEWGSKVRVQAGQWDLPATEAFALR